MNFKSNVFLVWILFLPFFISAQTDNSDKCGKIDKDRVESELELRGDHWGYGYDDLLNDLDKWGQSPYVTIDSMGASVQNRTLWELKITSPDTLTQDKHIIYIHVRTHPGEVQSFWVANEIINLLLSEDSLAVKTREKCIYYIVPMYNPDGVELEYARENANHIDIESNWYAGNNVQPEVMSLRNRFLSFMESDKHIEIALNMHSAYKCKRYFVVHDLNGTSVSYQFMEKRFVEGVRKYFSSGIEPWNFFVTWANGTPLKYPESWWWVNYGSDVLALTYEDGNCDAAGDFDITARAIVNGIADYLDIWGKTSNTTELVNNTLVAYPNPAYNKLNLDFSSAFSGKIEVYNS
ncbi:MAG TPA: hypothetical protein ENK91_02710, partial [Bacteroidetes bacterium]|nr:hypothetical protein [Bacteroidota bacterium]